MNNKEAVITVSLILASIFGIHLYSKKKAAAATVPPTELDGKGKPQILIRTTLPQSQADAIAVQITALMSGASITLDDLTKIQNLTLQLETNGYRYDLVSKKAVKK